MGRIIFIVAIVGLVFYILRVTEKKRKSEYKTCEKCDGKGFWEATKGDKDKCDRCGGSGKVLR